jgi:hypothetical protein
MHLNHAMRRAIGVHQEHRSTQPAANADIHVCCTTGVSYIETAQHACRALLPTVTITKAEQAASQQI